MSIWKKSDIQTLDYSFAGKPQGDLEAKSLNTVSLDYSFGGFPFVAPPSTQRRIFLVT